MIAAWLFYGGRETLQSFGVPEQIIASGDETAMMRAARAVIPSDVIRWLRALPMSRRIGDYLFVHAGVRPGVPLDEQDPVDMRWIRREFLESEADHGAVVVHDRKSVVEGKSVSVRVDDGGRRLNKKNKINQKE